MQRLFVDDVSVRKRARLPHWDTAHGIYSITFNLFDAIPADELARLKNEADAQRARIARGHGTATIAEELAIAAWMNRRIERLLDGGHGSCFLFDRRIAELVASSLKYFDAARYELLAWCVMPNHVHMLFSVLAPFTLASVMKSLKGYSARQANAILGRSGHFWQEEYFDRSIRSVAHLRRCVAYVCGNPAKAGLVQWPFVGMSQERLAPYFTMPV